MKKLALLLAVEVMLIAVIGLTVACSVSKSTATTTSHTTQQTTTTSTTPITLTATAPNSPHSYRPNACIICHKDGTFGAPIFPTSHASYADTLCIGCHKTIGYYATPKLPVDHSGRTACLICHENGLAGAPEIPITHTSLNHPAYSDTTPAAAVLCFACHKQN